jgi:hypothetical protein
MSNQLNAVDVSSHQPRDLSRIIAEYQPDHVIVKLYTSVEHISFEHSEAQVRSAWEHGKTVGGYAWAYRSASPERTIDDVIARCASIGLVLPLLWIDCETYHGGNTVDPGPDADWLSRAVARAEDVYGMSCGIYTGIWWINGHFPGGQAEFAKFNRLPLWLSEYDGIADINNIVLPQGWTEVAAKQFLGSPIDQNVIRPEYTVFNTPEDDDDDDDPCWDLRQELELKIEALAEAHAEIDDLKDRMSQIRELAEGVPDLD